MYVFAFCTPVHTVHVHVRDVKGVLVAIVRGVKLAATPSHPRDGQTQKRKEEREEEEEEGGEI